TDPTSDFLAYLNLWEYLRTAQRDLSGSAFRRTVRAEHLHYLRIREWQDLVAQLKSMAKSVGIPVNAPGARVGAASAPTSELAVSSARTGDLSEGSARTTHRKRAGVAGGSGAGADDGGARDRSAQSATGTLRLEWDADRIHVSLLAGL